MSLKVNKIIMDLTVLFVSCYIFAIGLWYGVYHGQVKTMVRKLTFIEEESNMGGGI